MATAFGGCGDSDTSGGKNFHNAAVLRASLLAQMDAEDIGFDELVCPTKIEGDEVICAIKGGFGFGDTSLEVRIQDGGKSYVTTSPTGGLALSDRLPD